MKKELDYIHRKNLERLVTEWRERIDVAGFTYWEFCRETGISYNTFIRLHESNPTIDYLDKVELAVQSVEAI